MRYPRVPTNVNVSFNHQSMPPRSSPSIALLQLVHVDISTFVLNTPYAHPPTHLPQKRLRICFLETERKTVLYKNFPISIPVCSAHNTKIYPENAIAIIPKTNTTSHTNLMT